MRHVVFFAWLPISVCALSLVLFGWTFQQRSNDVARVEALAQQTNAALCAFKDDLQRRYDAGLAFFKENPDGIQGISPADIAQSLANQRATLDSLASLDCQ